MNKNIEQQEVSDRAKESADVGHRGAFLKKEREDRGISIESVHEATKIPLDSLRAIEEDYKIRTMTEFYYNSFLKIYARYLGIDVSRVADQSKSAVRPKAVFKENEINFDILDKINRKLTKERKRQILFVCAAIFGLWLLIKFIGFIVHKKPRPSPAASSQTSQRDSDNVSEITAAGEEEVVFPEGDAATSSAIPMMADNALENASDPVSGKSVVLTVRAKKESWLRVKADGNVVFQSTLNVGDVETWDAGENIEITGRNLSELEFELNGKLIGSLGRSSRRAKALIVTKDGLSVTK